MNASEMATPAINSGNRIEYLLCGMCFPSKVALLNDPNVWIADTAATPGHSMLHNVCLKNLKEALTTDLVTMGNGADVRAKTIVQLPGVICNKHGNELQGEVLDNVTYFPGVKYNLFSLSNMTRHGGWKLSGDNAGSALNLKRWARSLL